MCLGDVLDDCQAEADACVVGAYAFGAAKKRLGEPWIIATVAGVGYRIDTDPDTEREGADGG